MALYSQLTLGLVFVELTCNIGESLSPKYTFPIQAPPASRKHSLYLIEDIHPIRSLENLVAGSGGYLTASAIRCDKWTTIKSGGRDLH